MATIVVHLQVGTPIPIDGLCPTCWLPSLHALLILIDNQPDILTLCQHCGPCRNPNMGDNGKAA